MKYLTSIAVNWQRIPSAKTKKTLNILDRKTKGVVSESLKN